MRSYRTITIYFTDGSRKRLAIDVSRGVRIEDGIARFGRTDSTPPWRELLAAPLTSILYWE